MTDDDDNDDLSRALTPERARRLILARRARFMAAALAGIAGAGCADGGGDGPGVCLSLHMFPDAQQPNGGGDASVCLTLDAQVGDGGMDSGPRVCLSLPLTCDGSTPARLDCPREDAGPPTDARVDDAAAPAEGGVQHFDSGP